MLVFMELDWDKAIGYEGNQQQPQQLQQPMQSQMPQEDQGISAINLMLAQVYLMVKYQQQKQMLY